MFFKKLNKLLKKSDKLKNLNLSDDVKMYFSINSKGKIVMDYENITSDVSDAITNVLVNEFEFIPGKIKGKNVGVLIIYKSFN